MRVRFRTPWQAEHEGWCQTSRAMARALKGAGVDVKLATWPNVALDAPTTGVLAEVEGLLETEQEAPFDVELMSFCLRGSLETTLFLAACDAATRFASARVFYTMTERTRLDPHIAEALNVFDEVWVPCRANERIFREAGVERVRLVPHPTLEPVSLKDRPLAPRFYWIGRWEPRKAPDRLIAAYRAAFSEGEAFLTIKTTIPKGVFVDYPFPFDLIRDRSDIKVIAYRISPEEITALHRKNAIYVSPSRGEGVDLPALAAKCHGNRLVYTESGGPEDFAGEDDLLVRRSGEVAAHPDYRWESHAQFIDYPVDELAQAMRDALVKPRAGSWPCENHTIEAVGQRMKSLLTALEGKPNALRALFRR